MRNRLTFISRWSARIAAALSPLLCTAIIVLWVRSYRYTDCLWVPDYRLQTFNGRAYVSKFGCGPAGFIYLWTDDFNPPNGPAFRDDLGVYSFMVDRQIAGIRSYHAGAIWFVGIPLWMLLAVFSIPLLRVGYRAVRSRRQAGFCPACNYNLTGNTSGICPECGRVIEDRSHAESRGRGENTKSI